MIFGKKQREQDRKFERQMRPCREESLTGERRQKALERITDAEKRLKGNKR